jgi:hypothetical protein
VGKELQATRQKPNHQLRATARNSITLREQRLHEIGDTAPHDADADAQEDERPESGGFQAIDEITR